ncbi:MAG: hypothetical protein KGM43_03375, partial [Planctomycetota bacterium]|nr:hypothetical protein [Planctomycetota bacterium]
MTCAPTDRGEATGATGRLMLAIETTCDETGAAVLELPPSPARQVPRVLSNVVASQIEIHERFGGVVPEMASRE